MNEFVWLLVQAFVIWMGFLIFIVGTYGISRGKLEYGKYAVVNTLTAVGVALIIMWR
jgi:hypothetical protein